MFAEEFFLSLFERARAISRARLIETFPDEKRQKRLVGSMLLHSTRFDVDRPYRSAALNCLNVTPELSMPSIRLRIEYGPEGGGDPKAIEVYAAGVVRELTYEAMDEVLKADISEAEVAAITRLLDTLDLSLDHIPCSLADSISLSYDAKGEAKSFWGEMGSHQFDNLLEIWIALERLVKRYFTPRFY